MYYYIYGYLTYRYVNYTYTTHLYTYDYNIYIHNKITTTHYANINIYTVNTHIPHILQPIYTNTLLYYPHTCTNIHTPLHTTLYMIYTHYTVSTIYTPTTLNDT